MSPFVLILIYCLLTIAASLGGGWLPSLVQLNHLKRQLMMSLVSGVMLGVALLHMLPASLDYLNSPVLAGSAMLGGLLVMFFLLRVFHVHSHASNDGHDCDHEHHQEHGQGHQFSWIGLFVGLAIHSLLDGVAISASVTADFGHPATSGVLLGLGTFLVVFLHKPLDALAITSLMHAADWSSSIRVAVNVIFSLICPIGAILFWFGAEQFTGEPSRLIGIALAFSAGFFLCIALSDLLPEVAFHSHDRGKLTIALVIGILLAGGIESMHTHEHTSGGQDAHQSEHRDADGDSPGEEHEHGHRDDHDHGDSHTEQPVVTHSDHDEARSSVDQNPHAPGTSIPSTENTLAPEDADELSATDLFQRRILPIMRSEKASSCTQCHFSGVELSNYIHEDQATTFAALRDGGLINTDKPEASKLLTFISRTTDQADPLLARVRAAELSAFSAWIHAAVADPELLASKSTDIALGTTLPPEVIRHMRRDHVLRSFVDNIWSEIGRCINCHSPERNQRLIEKHGDRVSWIVPRNPAATLESLVDAGNIDIDFPDESLVLLKPAGLEDHGGGPKFAPGSRTDKNYRRFLNDYSKTVNAAYRKTEELPSPPSQVAVPTGQHLRVIDLPPGLGQKLLKVDIYRWTDSGWSETRWGTAENPINGRKNIWQSIVFSTAPRDSQRAAELLRAKEHPLPPGRYLFKLYLDREGKTREDRDYELGAAEFLGEVEATGSWIPGYQPPKIIHAPR